MGRGDAGHGRRLALPGEDGEDHVAIGDARCQRFRAGRLDGIEPVVEHAGQHLDELPVGIRMVFKPLAHLREGRGKVPILERRPIA